MSHQQQLIAIDLGTTSIKGALLDLDACRISHIQRLPFPEPISDLPDLFCEIDVHIITRATRQLISGLLMYAPDCAGIVMCGQMGGLVLIDALGQPHSNYISWRDQRLLMAHPSGEGSYWDHFQRHLTDSDRRQLGNEVRPGLPVSFLYWLTERKQLPTSPLIAASLPDFVLANLCATSPATEITNAVGGVNVETRNWHHEVFAKLGFGQVGWSRLCDVRESVGTLHIDEQCLTCYAPVGDHQAALAGAFIQPGELSINISTGSQASLLTTELELGNYQTRPFFDGHYLNTITHIPAGRSLNVLLGLLGELAAAQQISLGDPWPYIASAVAAVSETDLEMDMAFFPSPVGSRGAIANIHEGNLSVGQLFRAAFCSMALNYRTCALRLSPTQAWERIVFSGGLAQNLEVLRQLIAEQFKCAHRLCATTEDALFGLLALGLVATGRANNLQAAIAHLAVLPEWRLEST